jgi:nucleoside phosphorylase
MNPNSSPPSPDGFLFAIVCAMILEFNAVTELLDHHWPFNELDPEDPNIYTVGRMGGHNVVIVMPNEVGNIEAATVTQRLKQKFKNVQLVLLVGICGAVPVPQSPQDKSNETEILLGDVIISDEVVRYLWRGRMMPEGFETRNTLLDRTGQPSERVLGLTKHMRTKLWSKVILVKMSHNLEQLQQLSNTYWYPGAANDKAYSAEYIHKHRGSGRPRCACDDEASKVCDKAVNTPCENLNCDESCVIRRWRLQGLADPSTHVETPRLHIGTIASGDIVMRSAEHRDYISKGQNAIAFEMEGAGVWKVATSCLVIKAACDYADSHKNKNW